MKTSKIRVAVAVDHPTPHPHKHVSVEDRVRDAVELIDSGYESAVEWDMIRRLWNYFERCGCRTERAKRVKELIKPVIDKYGQLDPRGTHG